MLGIFILVNQVDSLAKNLQKPLLIHDVSGYPPDIASFHPVTCLVPPLITLFSVAADHV